MTRLFAIAFICFGLTAPLFAAPDPAVVQGLYEGARTDGAGAHKLEARMVALAKGTYKLLIREAAADQKVVKVNLLAATAGDTVRVSGKHGDTEWAGAYADGIIKGTAGADSFELKRVVRESPTLGKAPPEGAIVLLDGKNFDNMTKGKVNNAEQEWKIVEPGAIQVPKGGMTSKPRLAGSFDLHVEFKNPLMPDKDGQGRGNSGVYLPTGEEIQVLDSFGMTTYEGGACGGLYKWKNTDVFDEFPLTSAPPLQWQTYDIEYRVQMEDGKPTGKPRVTVYHNGVKVHDNVELKNNAKPGPIFLQDHGDPVQYRNIWVLPVK